MGGVDILTVKELMRHKTLVVTLRYAHLAPDAHGKVRESWARRLDPRLTHEAEGGRSS